MIEYWGKLIKNNEYRKKTNIILNKLENPYLNVRIVIDYILKKQIRISCRFN